MESHDFVAIQTITYYVKVYYIIFSDFFFILFYISTFIKILKTLEHFCCLLYSHTVNCGSRHRHCKRGCRVWSWHNRDSHSSRHDHFSSITNKTFLRKKARKKIQTGVFHVETLESYIILLSSSLTDVNHLFLVHEK